MNREPDKRGIDFKDLCVERVSLSASEESFRRSSDPRGARRGWKAGMQSADYSGMWVYFRSQEASEESKEATKHLKRCSVDHCGSIKQRCTVAMVCLVVIR